MYNKERHICLILAGGSICMEPSADGYVPTKGQLLSKCLAVSPIFNDPFAAKLCSFPTVIDDTGTARPPDASFVLPNTSPDKPRVRYTAFEFHSPFDSCSADAYDWNILASCIVANYESFHGFVILHGTDTLSYAASALSFLLHPLRKPVVLTGSQVSIFDKRSDAWDNILGALSCASVDEISHCEVGLFFHRTLFRGNRTTKIHTSDYAAFATRYTPLSRLEEGGRQSKLCTPPTSCRSAFAARIRTVPPLEPLVSLSPQDVAVLRIYPGLPPSTISMICSTPSLRGLILETYGAGHMPSTPDFLCVLRSAITERGILIVIVSQCVYGSVTAHYAPARALKKLGVVHGEDMTTEAAYTKLLWLLAQRETLGLEEMKVLMTRNVRGELTESKNVDRDDVQPKYLDDWKDNSVGGAPNDCIRARRSIGPTA